jgi:RNA-directed DNA polymerase
MMHGKEQSDSPIVPRKPVNKAAQAVAESAEGSGGTKRNADLQRDAVKRNKKERLTALLHHVDIDCLRRAFFSLRKRAALGVDGVTWDQYAGTPRG